jgi:predicted AlkP superfamily pyrophosphatase or phosphodiesterase
MRVRLGFAALAIAFGIGAGSIAAPPPPSPKLIVAISVDQYSWDLFSTYRAAYTAGLKRLASGIVYTGYQSHGATETCPGHSTILTGRHPSGTGIIANDWYDRQTDRMVYCVAVPGAKDNSAQWMGPQTIHVDALGSWIKAARPGSRVFAMSGKDRAAIGMAGKYADEVYWWVDGQGFVTSTYSSAGTAPGNDAAQAYDRKLLESWGDRLPQPWPAQISPRCAAMQKAYSYNRISLSGAVPPEGSGEVKNVRYSPLFDSVLLDFAGTVIDRVKLGQGAGTDLLALSFSANDYVAHRFGPGGAEMCVQQAMLDATLGKLFARLDTLGVPYVVMLTADHGGSDAPERAIDHGIKGARVDSRALKGELNDALKAQFALAADPLKGTDASELSIARDVDPAIRPRLRAAAVAWLQSAGVRARYPIESVYTAEQVAAAHAPKGKPAERLTMLERLNESYDAVRSGDIMVVFRPRSNSYMPTKTGDYVSGHGSPWDYDRRVPILFWWAGVTPMNAKVSAETVDIAPTLAAIAQVPTPELDGTCLRAVAGCK